MPYPQLDRFRVKMEPLAARQNKADIDRQFISPDRTPGPLSVQAGEAIDRLAARVRAARVSNRPIMCAFGAHAIKNGLGPVFVALMQEGWLTHLATNGAGIIHDWEFSFQGKSCEDVQRMVREGRFGNWQETGFFINLALNVGAYEGKGYGESVGAMIQTQGLDIPTEEELVHVVRTAVDDDPETAAAAADLLWVIRSFGIAPGRMDVPHHWSHHSAQAMRSGLVCRLRAIR